MNVFIHIIFYFLIDYRDFRLFMMKLRGSINKQL
jgi:hypothetical protein